ncbi:MAG TPA: ElyC/SanA/YdcF family protein [Polyangia bacterium]|jgi:uncharacterized SAM-binding protein YcdF (DUF218 family)
MFVKKLVSYFLLPFPFSLLLLAVGLALLWFTARQRTGRVLVTVAASLLLLLSWLPTSQWLLTPLHGIPRLANPAVDAAGARWVVVLGGGYETSLDVPATSRLAGATLERLVEGIRVYRKLPGSKLLMSGGGAGGPEPTQARMMVEAAIALGVPEADTAQEGGSDDTADEAKLVHDMVGDAPIVLVTSAAHLRRSVRLFEKQGMKVFPAPAGYWPPQFNPLPNSERLGQLEAAEHEYLGMLWGRLRGTM